MVYLPDSVWPDECMCLGDAYTPDNCLWFNDIEEGLREHLPSGFGDIAEVLVVSDPNEERYAETCPQCGGVCSPDDLESTYCGSFCPECLAEHLKKCEVCR